MDYPSHFGGPPGPGGGGDGSGIFGLGNNTSPPPPIPHHILTFLTEDERRCIPEPIHSKIVTNFHSLTQRYHNTINEKQKLRISHEEQMSKIEKELKELREKGDTFNTQLAEERTEREQYVKKYQECLRTINELEDTVRKTQTSLSDSLTKIEQITTEKEELLILTNKRNTEIEKLTTDLKHLSEQLQSATAAKIDALVKVNELQSKELELDYKEKQLAKDRDWVGKQVDLLNDELERKNTEIIELQREFSLKHLGLQTEISEKAEKIRLAELQIENFKSTNEGQEKHIESLIEKLKEAQDMEMKMEENYRQELKSQKRIADLYKDSSEESSKKIDELEDAVSNLQDLLRMATERYGELESTHSIASKSFQDEILKRDTEIERLTKELQHANELLSNISKKGLTDEMIQSLSPAAAAATQMLRSSSSLTEIYSKYQTLKEQLLDTQLENEKLNAYVDEILKEVQNRAPLLQAQREDYERALETIDALNIQLDLSMETENKVKEEYYVVKKERDSLEREKNRLKSQLIDSANQVKVLLREIEVARGNYNPSGVNTSVDRNSSMNRSITDSNSLISERLVTFRNIDELQAQNQYLLSLVRELSEEREKIANKDEAGFDELKSAFQEAKKELEDLRELRVRQDANFRNLLEQRTQKLIQEQQQIAETKSTSSSPIKSFNVPGSDALSPETELKIKNLEKRLAEITEEYDTFKRERKENERIHCEQMEKLRDDLTRMRTDNAKLSSQTEYNNERAKIYTSNLERYKKSIEVLEEKTKQLSLTNSKYEQNIISLKSEIFTLQQKLSKAEMSLTTVTNERNLLRDSKSHLQAENEMFRREKTTEKILQLNLADIKNNLELNNTEMKQRYESKIEHLENENQILRRKVDSDNGNFTSTVLSWDKINKDLQTKLDTQNSEVEGLKKSLETSADTIRKQREEIHELLTKISVLTGGKEPGQVSTILSSIEVEKQTKELTHKLNEASKEIKALKQQLEISKDSLAEYKNLCKSMEEQIKDSKEIEKQAVASSTEKSSEVEKELIERLGFKDDIIRDLSSKIDTLEKENFKLKSDVEKMLNESQGKSTVLEDELSRTKRELQVANSKLQGTIEENSKVKADLEHQVSLTKEFQAKYTNQLNSHSNGEEELRNLRSDVDSLRSKIGEEERRRILAEEKLRELEEDWTKNEKTLREDLTRAQANAKELDEINSNLQDQLVALTTQMSSLRTLQSQAQEANSSVMSEPRSLDISFSTSFIESQDQSEQTRKTTEQWMQLIRYMRQQKEIAYSRAELEDAKNKRLEVQLEFLQKQNEELKARLDELQQSSHFSLLSSAKQAELLRKVETLSALTDSNRLLREEKDKALEEITDLRTQLMSLENQSEPLKLRNLQLENNLESLSSENESLKQDVSRWRTRAGELVEKANKMSPEEWKKLNTEKDNLTRQLKILQETSKKQTFDTQRLTQQMSALQAQIVSLQTEKSTLLTKTKTLTDELKKIETEKSKSQQELQITRSDFSSLREQLTKTQNELAQLKEQNTTTVAELDDQRNVVRQVKNIARRYKKTAEDSEKEIDELRKQLQAAQAQTAIAEPISAPEKADASIGTDYTMETGDVPEATAQNAEPSAMAAEVDGLKRDLEIARGEITSKEERAKLALRTLREKTVALNTQKTELESNLQQAREEITTLRTTHEESSVRLAALKSQYEGRINRMEKEIKDLKDSQGVGISGTAPQLPVISDLATENERLKKDNEMQRQRITALEKHLRNQQLQTAAGVSSGTAAPSATHSSSGSTSSTGSSSSPATGEPPKANIKPSPAATTASTTGAGTPPMNRPQPTASIRPMSMTKRATVQPQTQQQQTPPGTSTIPQQGVIAPVSQAQVSTSTPDGENNNNQGNVAHLVPVTSSANTQSSNSANVRQATVQPTLTVPISAPIVPSSQCLPTVVTASTGISQQQNPEASGTPTANQPQGSQEGPSTSSSTTLNIEDMGETGDSQEQVSSSEPSSHQLVLTVAPLRSSSAQQNESQQSTETSQSAQGSSISGAVVTSREEPSPSTSVSAQRATPSTSKRVREPANNDVETSDESPIPEPENKRSRLAPRPVDREAEAKVVGGQKQHQRAKPTPASYAGAEDDDSDVIVLDSDDDEGPATTPYLGSSRVSTQAFRSGSRAQAQEADEDEDVEDEELVDEDEDYVEVEDEDMEDEEDLDPEEEVDEDENNDNDDEGDADQSFEHGEVEQEDEGQDMDDEGMVEDDEPMEGREAESLEPDDESGEEGEINNEDRVQVDIYNLEEDVERPDESDEIEEINLVDVEELEAGEASPAVPIVTSAPVPETIHEETPRPQSSSGSGPTSSRPQALPSRGPGRQERLPSYGRQQPLTPSFQPYPEVEGGDESIVPSTPTLFVPRRSDGFAEAVSSPQVPSSGAGGIGRFTFNTMTSSSTDTVPGTSSFMDDSRINLMGYDDTESGTSGGPSGRSVPSTPLQVSPPVDIGDEEPLVSGRDQDDEDSEERRDRDDSHPSSSFASVPSITITATSGGTLAAGQEQEAEAQRDVDEMELEILDEEDDDSKGGGQQLKSRVESSVTSSDEDKGSAGIAASSLPTATTIASSASPSTSSRTVPEQPTQTSTTRVRPKPIVWDQPTSSSGSSSSSITLHGQQPASSAPHRGFIRGSAINRGILRSSPNVVQQHLLPQQQEGAIIPGRGIYRPMQSARRSRPHMTPRGSPRPRGSY